MIRQFLGFKHDKEMGERGKQQQNNSYMCFLCAYGWLFCVYLNFTGIYINILLVMRVQCYRTELIYVAGKSNLKKDDYRE